MVLISTRDPVDIFQSAFNWRSWVLCANSIDLRIHDKYGNHAAHPELYCNKRFPEEQAMLTSYGHNPNNLAEALCDTGAVGLKARKDWLQILHAQWTLSDWLPDSLLQDTKLKI